MKARKVNILSNKIYAFIKLFSKNYSNKLLVRPFALSKVSLLTIRGTCVDNSLDYVIELQLRSGPLGGGAERESLKLPPEWQAGMPHNL